MSDVQKEFDYKEITQFFNVITVIYYKIIGLCIDLTLNEFGNNLKIGTFYS